MFHHRVSATSLRLAIACLAYLAATPVAASPCPSAGATLRIEIQPPPEITASTLVLVVGTLRAPSCEDDGPLATGYAGEIACGGGAGASCSAVFTALRPGHWVHQVVVPQPVGTPQLQARRDLLLDASAGTHIVRWPLYQSVITVASLLDTEGCDDCLRGALVRAIVAPPPTLIQFSPTMIGTLVLTAALPALTDRVTIDGFDIDGEPHGRTLDVGGLGVPALTIRGSGNAVTGLRLTNVGRNSDSFLIEGAAANGNLVESLQIAGRAREVCGTLRNGCIVEGVCRTPETDPGFGACGDDGIAIRDQAGRVTPNIIRQCEVTGAFDKGIKVSDSASAQVERSLLRQNRDGGLQATTSGQLVATENWVEYNTATVAANGLAANGAAPGSSTPARLESCGNVVRYHSLRGISVRGLSEADLRHDHVCGNSHESGAFGVAVLDAGGASARATLSGLASVLNAGGVVVAGASSADLGSAMGAGQNALAFNSSPNATMPRNLQHLAAVPLSAANNQWEHCGSSWRCDDVLIGREDVFRDAPAGALTILPTQPHHRRRRPTIDHIAPTFAAAGDLVRVYGSGFDAVDGNGPAGDCADIIQLNTCRPLRGNCVFVDRTPAEVVAVTPTMLVIRVPRTCVQPVSLAVRARYGRGTTRVPFCVLPGDDTSAPTGPPVPHTLYASARALTPVDALAAQSAHSTAAPSR